MPNVKESPWLELGISRATYFRRKKAGIPIVQGEKHSKFLDDWIKWREEGLETKPWSSTYKSVQIFYMEKFFTCQSLVDYTSVHKHLKSISNKQHTKRRHIHSALSSFAKYLCSRGRLSQEEYLQIKSLCPKAPPQYRVNQRIIYSEQLDTLIEAAGENHSSYQALLNQTLLVFLSETALRVTEACNLEMTDLKFSDNPTRAFIKVRHGKGNKSRVVPFSRKAQEVILEYQRVKPEHSRVFLAFNPVHGYTPLTKDGVARRFKAISEQKSIPFSAHSLRHYRITLWANNPRIPITVVQKWAGHSSLEITQRYIHIRDEEALMAAFE